MAAPSAWVARHPKFCTKNVFTSVPVFCNPEMSLKDENNR
jgi:hypothetical protein